jgi:hypothetical protein
LLIGGFPIVILVVLMPTDFGSRNAVSREQSETRQWLRAI